MVASTFALRTLTPASLHFTNQLPDSPRVNRPVTCGYKQRTSDRAILKGSTSKIPSQMGFSCSKKLHVLYGDPLHDQVLIMDEFYPTRLADWILPLTLNGH
jgi:hypothetical protein